MKKFMKKGILKLLAVLICLAAVIVIGFPRAQAEGPKKIADSPAYSLEYPRGYPTQDNYSNKEDWSHEAMNFMNGWHCGKTSTNLHSMESYNGKVV